MKRILLIIILLSLTLTTGCWDMMEVNQRIFPYSAGIDLNDSGESNFKITFTYPNINALGKNATQDKRVYIISATGDDIFDASHNLSSRLQYPIFFKHLKVLVLQEKVAQNEKHVKEIVDGINRDYIINKTVQMAIVRDSAEKLLNSVPNAERQEIIEGTLFSLISNHQNSSQFTPRRLSDFIEDMDNRGASVLPVINPKEGEIELSGGAIFKDYSLVGYIDAKDNQAIALLNGELSEDGFHSEYNGINLSILATSFKAKRKLEESENLKIVYSVEIEGQIHEYTLADGAKIDSVEMVRGMEAALVKDIEDNLNQTIKKLQKEYKADVIKVADYLRKYHNKLWTQVEDDWDEVFSNADITAKVDVKIRRRGLTK